MSKVFRFALLLTVAVLAFSAATPASAQSGRPVYAFYFGWWTGDSWGDPSLSDRPATPYDERDPNVIGMQIDQARGAGIDAFIMSYYGPAENNLTHQTFNALLDQAGARGFGAAAAVDLGSPSFNNSVDAVTQTLSYIVNDRANHPAYLRYNGKPVIYFWQQGRFGVGDWQNIRNQVDPNHNTIWVAEGADTSFIGAFDGLYLFNVAWSGNFASTAAQWNSATRSAGGTFYSATVHPGWDENAIAARDGRTNPTDAQGRSGGEFLTRSWNGAASSAADAILIVSWNEYFENSHIEPSQNHGSTALDTLRPLISAWKGGAPVQQVAAPAAAPIDGAAPPAALSGQTFTLLEGVNFRSAPGTNSAVLARIAPSSVLTVVGRNGDGSWVQVDNNGTMGWIASYLGSLNTDINALPVTG